MLSPGPLAIPVFRSLYSAHARVELRSSRSSQFSKSAVERSGWLLACCYFVKVFFAVLEICSVALLGVVRVLSLDPVVLPVCTIPPSQRYRARVVLWFSRPSGFSSFPPTRRHVPYAALFPDQNPLQTPLRCIAPSKTA